MLESTKPPHGKRWLDENIASYCPFDKPRLLKAQRDDELSTSELEQTCLSYHRTLPGVLKPTAVFPASCRVPGR